MCINILTSTKKIRTIVAFKSFGPFADHRLSALRHDTVVGKLYHTKRLRDRDSQISTSGGKWLVDMPLGYHAFKTKSAAIAWGRVIGNKQRRLAKVRLYDVYATGLQDTGPLIRPRYSTVYVARSMRILKYIKM